MPTGNDRETRNEQNEDAAEAEKDKEDLEDAEDRGDDGKASGAPAYTHKQIFGDSGEIELIKFDCYANLQLMVRFYPDPRLRRGIRQGNWFARGKSNFEQGNWAA
jgi:hypothetical protein